MGALHNAWELQLVYSLSVNTDEDILEKRTLSECPVENEFVWDGRKPARRHFTDTDDYECFVAEVDVAEDIDTFTMTLSR